MKIRDRLNKDRQVITEAYLAGESTCSLGRRYDCSNASIFLMLREWGVQLRQMKTVEPNYEKILQLHHQGYSAYRIDRELGLPKSTAERALKKAGIDISARQWRREDPLHTHTDEIIARYQAGEGVNRIAKDFKTQDASIIRFLRRKGIELRSLRHYAYPVNESYFDVIDTEQKAYILGLFMADGSNDQKKGVTSLSITDRGLCAAIAQSFQFEGPIDSIPPRKIGHRIQYRINIGSRKMSDALARCGCVSRKTYIAEVPSLDIVSVDLQRHMIRGWLDGDGTITQDRKTRRWISRIVGTEAVCRDLSGYVSGHIGFLGSVYPVHWGSKHTTWGFTVGGKDQLSQYLNWLYDGAVIFLCRKFDKYISFCNQYGLTPVSTAGSGV